VSPDPVRLAVIGAGRMGLTHIDVVRGLASISVAAVVEPDADARARAAQLGPVIFASLDELLEANQVDAALVVAPSTLHLGLVSVLAAAGVPILCEKPCGTTADDAREAQRVASSAGVLLQVGYWRRFVPELAELREAIVSGDLGEPIQVGCWQWDLEPPSQQFRDTSGGIAIDMGVHEFDQLRWLASQEIEEVTATGYLPAGAEVSADDPDAAALVVRLSGGTIGIVSLGRRFAPGDSCWTEVMGTGGHRRAQFMWGDGAERAFRSALAAQAEAFADAVRGGEPRGASGEDAVAALTAAERAAAALGASAPQRVR
jgi:myo-inositol 2-dehydrogenase / D-chiro-inositol 1-dehydrogenase